MVISIVVVCCLLFFQVVLLCVNVMMPIKRLYNDSTTVVNRNEFCSYFFLSGLHIKKNHSEPVDRTLTIHPVGFHGYNCK